MRTPDLDRKLELLRQAAERISANLVELEIDSSRQLLEASTLEGESARRWSAASAALTELWRRRTLLENLLERAGKLKGGRRAGELEALLEGQSIELGSTTIPLAQRELLESSEVAERCSPRELLASMSAAFEEVKAVAARIGAAWETLVPQIEAARRLLQEARQLADELGGSVHARLDSASQKLNLLGAAVTADPLSVSGDDAEKLIQSLGAIRNELADSLALKRGFEARILEARGRLTQLESLVRDGQVAHAELLLKISAPTPPPAPEVEPGVEVELARITELAARGAWEEASRAHRRWMAHTDALLDDAQRSLERNRAPIQARNQLRALLEAYQVKAKRLGMLERSELEEIYARAQDVLFNAPSDLTVAAQLVRSYQTAINDLSTIPEATR